MNLRLLYDKIVELSKAIDPNVGNTFYGDVYDANFNQTVKYPCVVVTPQTHIGDMNNYSFSYRLNVFYIDRLTDNDKNKIDVHSISISFLNDLLKALNDELIISNWEINNFSERFNDVCAGGYLSVNIEMPISECYDTIEEEEKSIFGDIVLLTNIEKIDDKDRLINIIVKYCGVGPQEAQTLAAAAPTTIASGIYEKDYNDYIKREFDNVGAATEFIVNMRKGGRK